jgi:hypothetical protein
MGKSARAANRVEKTERQAKQLTELTNIIGELWGNRSECVEAAVLFVATAQRLSIPVEARAVSILAVDTTTGDVAMTGIAAATEAEQHFGATALGVPTDLSERSFARAGHMIVTSDQLSMFFDPTFRQFSKNGLPDLIVAGKVAQTRPPSGRISVGLHNGRVQISYFFDDANTGWQDGVDAVTAGWASVADELASHIRSGGSAATIGFEIPWEEHPGH